MAKENICNRCGKNIAFRRNSNGRWIPINPDGSEHFKICDRAHLFGKSPVKCYGCEVNLERDSGEFHPGRLDLPDGFFPSKDYRSLSCSSCGWGYDWYEDRDRVTYEDVEKYIFQQQKLDPEFQYKLRNLRIVKGEQ